MPKGNNMSFPQFLKATDERGASVMLPIKKINHVIEVNQHHKDFAEYSEIAERFDSDMVKTVVVVVDPGYSFTVGVTQTADEIFDGLNTLAAMQ
jgi:hypothetical protein